MKINLIFLLSTVKQNFFNRIATLKRTISTIAVRIYFIRQTFFIFFFFLSEINRRYIVKNHHVPTIKFSTLKKSIMITSEIVMCGHVQV